MWNMEINEGQIKFNYQSATDCGENRVWANVFFIVFVCKKVTPLSASFISLSSIWMSPDDRIAAIIIICYPTNRVFFLLRVHARWHRKSILAWLCFVANFLFDLFVDARQKFSTFKVFSQPKTFYGFVWLEDVGGVDWATWPLISRWFQNCLVSVFDWKYFKYERKNFRHIQPWLDFKFYSSKNAIRLNNESPRVFTQIRLNAHMGRI